MQEEVTARSRPRTFGVWIGLVVGLIAGAGITTVAAMPNLWWPLLRVSAPDPVVLPHSIGVGSYPVEVPPVRSLVFLDMTAPYKALAEASYPDVWETAYLWRPDRPLHPRETRQVIGGATSLIELLDESAQERSWRRDDRFRHDGWSITSAGYERDGYVFVVAVLGRRTAHMQDEHLIIGPDADAEIPPGTVLPVVIFTNLPRPQNPAIDAPWLAPDAWRTE